MSKERILIIVESPGKIKKIKECLPEDTHYDVIASIGHIADLSTKFKHNLGINIDKDFEPNYITNKDKLDVLNSIIGTATLCDKILLATDDDREGECISYLISERLKTCKKPIKRITFNEITKKTILKSLKNERDVDINLVKAAMARRALDRIVGYMASPFLIKNIGKGASAGRVQSVALKLVVERENEIKSFIPEEYWNIKINLSKDTKPFIAKLNKEEIESEIEADVITDELNSSTFTVSKIKSQSKVKKPPAPLITSTLQMLASSKYKISVVRTMEAAQSLYEDGLITYMRTDSKRLSEESISDIRNWISENHRRYLPLTPNVYKNKESAQDAHEAIRPTHIDTLPEKTPSNDKEKIYKLIWNITVASQMKSAVYGVTSVDILTDKNRELKATGRILLEQGWLTVTKFGDISEDEKYENDLLPILNKGDILNVVEPGIIKEQKFTQPPSRYKEATLIEELEKKGIGRPSTYASIMSKICETRNFISKVNDTLKPTDLGNQIVEILDKNFSFMKYCYTSDMEKNLDSIAENKSTYVEIMNSFFKPFNEELIAAYKVKADEKAIDNIQERINLTDPNNTGYICEQCKFPMVLKKSIFGYFLGCSNYPYCKKVIPCKIIKNLIVPSEQECKQAPGHIKCPICKSSMVIRPGKFGEYYCCSIYPQCKGKRKMPYGKPCPECGKDLYRTIFLRPPFMGPVLCCTSYPRCKHIELIEEEIQDNWREKRAKIMERMLNNRKRLSKCIIA